MIGVITVWGLSFTIEHGALSHRRPASAGIFHDCCRAQDGGNRNTLYTVSKAMKFSIMYGYESFQAPSEEKQPSAPECASGNLTQAVRYLTFKDFRDADYPH
jgi:hypothetical protein